VDDIENMEAHRILYLYQQYREHKASVDELEELQLLLADGEAGKALRDSWHGDWLSISDEEIRILNLDSKEENFKAIVSKTQFRIKKIRLWPQIAIAAAVITIIFGAGLFYFYNQPGKTEQATAYVNDIAPGKQGATLTLANGQKILINEAAAGNIASQSGVKISKTADGKIIYEISERRSGKLEYNTLSTTRGEQTQLRLPDGSVVFLNAASSLKYPTSFANLDKRSVSLTGEGYFEITRDKAHPFVVESKGQKVEVLGTHFNINAYQDEPVIKTTLLEGRVRVIGQQTEKILVPGFEAVNTGSGIALNKVDTELAVAWKNNNFMFENGDIKSIMRMVERWYNVEVIYQGKVPMDALYGTVSRFDKVSSVLRILESAGGVHFKIVGRKVYVSAEK